MSKVIANCKDPTFPVITEPDSLKTVVGQVDLSEDDQRDLMFYLLVKVRGLTPGAAARKMGLHECSGSRKWKSLNDNQKKHKSLVQKFIESQAETYRVKNSMNLERISTVESKILDLLEKSPELASKYPSFFRQAKVVAGIMSDPAPIQPTIHIESVAQMMLNVGTVAPIAKPDME